MTLTAAPAPSDHPGVRQLDDTIEYVRTREQFGQPVGKFQSVSNRIADMRLRMELARMISCGTASGDCSTRVRPTSSG